VAASAGVLVSPSAAMASTGKGAQTVKRRASSKRRVMVFSPEPMFVRYDGAIRRFGFNAHASFSFGICGGKKWPRLVPAMEAERILAEVDAGVAPAGLTVFRFRRGPALLETIVFGGIGVAGVAFAIIVAPRVNPDVGLVRYGGAAVAGFFLLMLFLRLRQKVAELRRARTNVLLVSSEGVIRRLGGRVEAWPFARTPEMTIVLRSNHGWGTANIHLGARPLDGDLVASDFYEGRISEVFLSQAGGTFGNIVVDDGSFGSMSEIVQTIVLCAPAPPGR
jgi:hypothetical protein